MKKEYRNKLIATAILLLGIMAFVTIDAYVSYEPENEGTTQMSEQINE